MFPKSSRYLLSFTLHRRSVISEQQIFRFLSSYFLPIIEVLTISLIQIRSRIYASSFSFCFCWKKMEAELNEHWNKEKSMCDWERHYIKCEKRVPYQELCRGKLFVGRYFRHQKKHLSLLPNEKFRPIKVKVSLVKWN